MTEEKREDLWEVEGKLYKIRHLKCGGYFSDTCETKDQECNHEAVCSKCGMIKKTEAFTLRDITFDPAES